MALLCRSTGPHKFKTSGTHWQGGAFSVKAKYMKPNDLKFLLKVKCSDTKEQPFRRMEITSQFQVSEVPAYVVCFSVFGGCSRRVFFKLVLTSGVEFHSLCCIKDDVLNDCTCEFQEIRQQPPFLSRAAWQHAPQQFLSCAATCYFYRGHAALAQQTAGCRQLDPLIINFVDCVSLSGLQSGGFCEQ